MQLLELLRSRANRRNETAAETLWAAAKRAAAGERADDGVVDAAMSEAGVTLDDFAALVDVARKRATLFAALDRGMPARTKHDKLAATAAAEREAFEHARRQWLERAATLNAELDALDRMARAGDDARVALCDPKNLPPAMAARIQAALDVQQAAAGVVAALRRDLAEQREIEKRRTWMAEQKRTAGKHHPLDVDDDERMAKRAAKRAVELEAQLREAESAEREAEEQLTKCRAAALKT